MGGNFRMGIKQFLDIGKGKFAAPGFTSYADNPPDHFPQEVRSRDAYGYNIGEFFQLYIFNINLGRCSFIHSLVGKGRKIMKSAEDIDRPPHFFDIQFVFDPPDITLAESCTPSGD